MPCNCGVCQECNWALSHDEPKAYDVSIMKSSNWGGDDRWRSVAEGLTFEEAEAATRMIQRVFDSGVVKNGYKYSVEMWEE